ncbi:hypothetical protein PPYR_00521 [Photinus pyralis]|uniref:Uncharacterized protein n=1 Tax=Photinus pyralis TaxID=7054 RepID=A0A5N4B1R5_PHOPY|nr:hypothetical protein PPYR_00521 [Photinus pyralis]
MPLTYKQKTDRERKTPEQISQAVQLVLQNNISASEELPDSDLSEYDPENDRVSEDFDHSASCSRVGDYVVVKFTTKRTCLHYVGNIQNVNEQGFYVINFLRRKTNSNTFYYPEETDISEVDFSDIVLRLSPPNNIAGTNRTQKFFNFDIDLSSFKNLK